MRASHVIEPIVPGMKRRRYENERGSSASSAAELGQERDPGEVVVRERRVADVRRQQHLVLALAREEALAVGERARLERAVDHDLVLAVLESRRAARCARQKPQVRE